MAKILSKNSAKTSDFKEKKPPSRNVFNITNAGGLVKKIFSWFKKIDAIPKKDRSLEKTEKIYDFISKLAIYFLIFLLPVFFLPWTSNVLDFNKQALLLALVFISLFSWMLKVLISGRIIFKLTRFHIGIGVLFLVSLASTAFSLWRYGSFWGLPLNISESLISLLCFTLLYFLIVNIFKKKDIPRLINLLIISGFFAILYGILQIFGRFILPLDFTKITSFNTIGSVNRLGLFSAVLLPLVITSLIAAKRRITKLIFSVILLTFIFSLILIDFSAVWWVAIVVAALIMAVGMQRSDFFDNRWLVLPMFLLAISLFFIFFDFKIPGTPGRPVEVFLSNRTSLDIAIQTLKERPILGSGPGTFIYDFSQYKKETFNRSSLWNIRFDGAGSKIINTMATTGILGILSLLAIMGLFVFYGIKLLVKKDIAEALSENREEIDKKTIWLTGAGIFISFVVLSIAYFLYNSNLSLDFIFFLLFASFISLLPTVKKEFVLKSSSLFTFGVTFIFTIIFIFGLGFFILEGQRYSAEVSYLSGLKASRSGNFDEALAELESAARKGSKIDLYWRDLAQVYLSRISSEIKRTDLPKEEINQRIQFLINNAVNSAKMATDVNPKNSVNWSVRGFIYSDLIGVVNGVEDWAVRAYEEAQRLEPANPYYPTQKGIVLLRKISFYPAGSGKEKESIVADAKNQFEQAIELKSDYAPARFQLAMIYQAIGNPENAIEELKRTKTIVPSDIGVAFQLGLIYFQMQDYNDAQVEFERAVAIDSNYSNALYFLGLTYDKQGKRQAAIEKFEKVVELNPSNSEVMMVLDNLRAGKGALEGIVEEVPPVAPVGKTLPEGAGKE